MVEQLPHTQVIQVRLLVFPPAILVAQWKSIGIRILRSQVRVLNSKTTLTENQPRLQSGYNRPEECWNTD